MTILIKNIGGIYVEFKYTEGFYKILVIWSGVEDRSDLDKGMVISVSTADNTKKETIREAVRPKVYDDPRFIIQLLKGKSYEQLVPLTKKKFDPVFKHRVLAKRGYILDIEDTDVKDKKIWEAENLDKIRKVKNTDIKPQPDLVRIA